MASDDDVKAGLNELSGASRRSARLSQFVGEGSSPAPKAKADQPKPISMMKESDIKKAEGSMAHIGKGAGKTITLEEWVKKLNRAMPFLGADLSYKAQIASAEGVAGLLRNFLSEGVDPQLSGFTVGRRRNRLGLSEPGKESAGAYPIQDHNDRSINGMALAALAPHVKVNKPAKNRKRGAKAKDGKPGYPGVFAKGYQPCTISFDSEKMDKIAHVLEHGMIWKPPQRVRQALMAQAIEGGFKPTEKNTTGYWEIPPRPFLHVIAGAEAQRIVRKTAEAAMMGTLRQEIAKRKELYVDAIEHAGVDVDSLSDVLSTGDSEDDFLDMIDESLNRSGRRRR